MSIFTTSFPVDTLASSFMHLNPPCRAEHLGSLLRPPMLLERRAQHESKTCTAEELEEAENAAIAAAVSLQESIGLKTITDGEMRRYVRFQFRILEPDTDGMVLGKAGRFTRAFLRNSKGWRPFFVCIVL